MKILTLAITACMLCAAASAQVSLTYSSIKLADKKYAISITATIDGPWHIYSIHQPPNGIGQPTEVQFNKHPLIKLQGQIAEKGDLQKVTEPITDSENWQYSHELKLTQQVAISGNIRTELKGSITYQACTDEKCLPPRTVNFSIPLNNSK